MAIFYQRLILITIFAVIAILTGRWKKEEKGTLVVVSISFFILMAIFNGLTESLNEQ